MEGEFRKILTSIIVLCLFGFILLVSAISLGNQYGKDTSDLDNAIINLSGLNNTLNSAESTANDWKDTFTGQKSILGTDSIILTGIFDIGKTMWNIMIAPIYLIISMMGVLGIPTVVSSVLVFLIIVAFIFSLWRLIRVADT